MSDASDTAQRAINTANRAHNSMAATPDTKILADAIVELARAVKSLDQQLNDHPAR
jgi:hypothetical protein